MYMHFFVCLFIRVMSEYHKFFLVNRVSELALHVSGLILGNQFHRPPVEVDPNLNHSNLILYGLTSNELIAPKIFEPKILGGSKHPEHVTGLLALSLGLLKRNNDMDQFWSSYSY